MMHWRDFTGKEVVVYAQGTTYRGRLIEMTEGYVLLRAETGHCEIPMGSISTLELADASSKASPLFSPSPLSGYTGGDKK